jgi:hypothetical protein
VLLVGEVKLKVRRRLDIKNKGQRGSGREKVSEEAVVSVLEV